jgi:hypothetical protein
MDIAPAPLVAALILAAVYVAGGPLSTRGGDEGFWSRRRWLSAAAGVSVAYVFVDVLPELAAQNRALIAAAGAAPPMFAEQRVYVVALLSFVVLYGIQYVVLASRDRGRTVTVAGTFDPVYALHLGGFVAYSALIGYLLVERAERGLVALVVYVVAMALHFLIVDHSLYEEHARRYARSGRLVLAASVLAGWLVGSATTLSDVVFARLFAALAGGVVITSLRGELPDQRKGRFWPFLLGALGFAVILLFA